MRRRAACIVGARNAVVTCSGNGLVRAVRSSLPRKRGGLVSRNRSTGKVQARNGPAKNSPPLWPERPQAFRRLPDRGAFDAEFGSRRFPVPILVFSDI